MVNKYIAIFKIYNGEATYNMPVGTEAVSKEEAEEYFKGYVCDNSGEIWTLVGFQEVKTFQELWDLVR